MSYLTIAWSSISNCKQDSAKRAWAIRQHSQFNPNSWQQEQNSIASHQHNDTDRTTKIILDLVLCFKSTGVTKHYFLHLIFLHNCPILLVISSIFKLSKITDKEIKKNAINLCIYTCIARTRYRTSRIWQRTLVLRISQNSAICTETKTLSQLVIVKKTG